MRGFLRRASLSIGGGFGDEEPSGTVRRGEEALGTSKRVARSTGGGDRREPAGDGRGRHWRREVEMKMRDSSEVVIAVLSCVSRPVFSHLIF